MGAKASQHGLAITHLIFADDRLLFCKATRGEGLRLKEVLQQYELISGQSINFDKSGLIFSPNIPAGDKIMDIFLWLNTTV